MTQELRERVARAMAATHGYEPDALTYREADAAIALVLEEAARVVRRMPSPSSEWMADELLRALGGPANPVPAAIRALKESK